MSKRPLSDGEGSSPKKKRAVKEPKPLDPKKFGGKTEEEVCQMLLPDHLAPDLDIIFMGINPGLYSAYLGHHYCNANNHFWPCLYESGLIPNKLSFMHDAEVLNYGIGMSNIVPRTTRSAAELSRKEIKEWSKVMIERMQELKPLIICFNGKGIYEIYTGGKCTVGIQEEPLPGTDIVVYVMPSTSGRAATYPRRSDKLKFFNELKDLRDRLRRERSEGRGTSTNVTSEAVGHSDPMTNDCSHSERASFPPQTVSSSCTGHEIGGSKKERQANHRGAAVPERKTVIVGTETGSPYQRDCIHSSRSDTGCPSSAATSHHNIDGMEPTDQTSTTTIESPYFHKQT